MAQPTIREVAGVSLDLWVPDEEIFHANINIRERRFGAVYHQDFIGASTGSPTFNDFSPSFLFGSPSFGFAVFGAVAGAGLVFDTITQGEVAPTFIDHPSSGLFDVGGDIFGFLSFGSVAGAGLIIDSVDVGDLAPVFVDHAAFGVFDIGTYYFGFLTFGSATPLVDTIDVGDLTPTFFNHSLVTQKFGAPLKFGFAVFV